VNANNDTLYGSVALDLSREPVLLYTPDIGNRFFLYQAMDAHAKEFAYSGTRFTDGKEGTFAFVGPGWRGILPEGVRWIQSSTPHVWIAGHVLAEGPQDVQPVRDYARSQKKARAAPGLTSCCRCGALSRCRT
jgi:hypothetical protein